MNVLKFTIFLAISVLGLISVPLTETSPLLVLIYILSAQMITLVVLKKTSPKFLASPLTGTKLLLLIIYPPLVRVLSTYPAVQIMIIGVYLALFSPFEIKKI